MHFCTRSRFSPSRASSDNSAKCSNAATHHFFKAEKNLPKRNSSTKASRSSALYISFPSLCLLTHVFFPNISNRANIVDFFHQSTITFKLRTTQNAYNTTTASVDNWPTGIASLRLNVNIKAFAILDDLRGRNTSFKQTLLIFFIFVSFFLFKYKLIPKNNNSSFRSKSNSI